MDNELLWAVLWALVHVIGVVAVLTLRCRSARQLLVAEHWHAHAAPADRQEAGDLVLLTRDRHRRNGALAVVVGGYLLLGLIVVSYTLYPWLDGMAYRVISRLILTIGEVVLIGSAWASVVVGDRIAAKTTRSRS
jgi:divalent metal cation (Fe/Co/Zn/Cd) transporter